MEIICDYEALALDQILFVLLKQAINFHSLRSRANWVHMCALRSVCACMTARSAGELRDSSSTIIAAASVCLSVFVSLF
jgi:hypothetical protein